MLAVAACQGAWCRPGCSTQRAAAEAQRGQPGWLGVAGGEAHALLPGLEGGVTVEGAARAHPGAAGWVVAGWAVAKVEEKEHPVVVEVVGRAVGAAAVVGSCQVAEEGAEAEGCRRKLLVEGVEEGRAKD